MSSLPHSSHRQEMPTRIVLRESAAHSGRRAHRRETVEDFATRPTLTPPSRISTTSPHFRPSVQRSISVNFRSALRHDEDDEDLRTDVSSTDIRASPRLMGYLSCCLSSAVMLVSVIQFYRADDRQASIIVFRRQLNETGTIDGDGEESDAVFGSTVLEPKLIGAIAVASAGVFFNMVILWMHLDTFVCPRVWREVFCDGSVHERNLLILLIVFWIFGLYVCTSSFSVGEVQANVYFTAWICFFSILMNYRQWRVSAGKKTLQDRLVNERETCKNWCGTLLSSFIAALSVCDLYGFRNNLTFVIDGQQQKITQRNWVEVLSVVWSCVGACIGMLIMIHFWKKPRYPCGPSGCRFDGRFIECGVLLTMIAVWFYGILEFTEVNGAINGPSNAYFGIWSSFFYAIATFGTWLKENRNIVHEVVPKRMGSMGSEHSMSSGRMASSERVSNVSSGGSAPMYSTRSRE